MQQLSRRVHARNLADGGGHSAPAGFGFRFYCSPLSRILSPALFCVIRKYMLTCGIYRITIIPMSNILSMEKQVAVVAALAEGTGIRSIERMTGIHRDTIMRLG